MVNKTTASSIFEEISKLDETSFPPVHLWNPPLCKNVDIRIDREGRWFFMNSPIGRQRMVNLFSRVLRYDDDGFYYLVTPVEKIKLEVEDKPFLIVDYNLSGDGNKQMITFITNTNEEFLLSSNHPMRLVIDEKTEEPSPYVLVRSNLEGLISRNIFYKLVDIAMKNKSDLGIWSDGIFFRIG
jgi:hypothetical protein